MFHGENPAIYIRKSIERTAQKSKELPLDTALIPTWNSPEEGAEKLYRYWRNYQKGFDVRQQQQGKSPEERKQLFQDFKRGRNVEAIQVGIRALSEDPAVWAMFTEKLKKVFQEEEALRPLYERWKKAQELQKATRTRRDELFRQCFQRGGKLDAVAKTILENLQRQIRMTERDIHDMEHANADFAAFVSFERISAYRDQLDQNFIWTPSRERYCDQIVHHIIFSGRRPLLLTGETGTGKTELARAVAQRLTGRPALEVHPGKNKPSDLFGQKGFDKDGTFVKYGSLGQAMTGKISSRDQKAGSGGIFYMDELNKFSNDTVLTVTKQLPRAKLGKEVSFDEWEGEKERVVPEFAFLASANLPSEKHPDRQEFPVEVTREIDPLEIDYPPQTPQDPELYEMMLTALMDEHKRIHVPEAELAPAWKDISDPSATTKRYELDIDPGAGGTLWRFANFVADVQAKYKEKEKKETNLEKAILAPGIVLGWLQEYRDVPQEGKDLQTFLSEKIDAWRSGGMFPEQDRKNLHSMQQAFDLEAPEHPIEAKSSVFTPIELGALSPRVPRGEMSLADMPLPSEETIIDIRTGTATAYLPKGIAGDAQPGVRFLKKGEPALGLWTFKGVTDAAGDVVLARDQKGGGEEVLVLPLPAFSSAFELHRSTEYKEKTPDGREVTFDFAKAQEAPRRFYASHLPEFGKSLPKDIRLPRRAEEKLREALRQGFTEAWFFPRADIQTRDQQHVLDACSKEPVDPSLGLSPTEQYEAPEIYDAAVFDAEPPHRPERKAYLLLYRPDIPPETIGKSPKELDELCAERGWVGWTMTEEAILERKACEENKDHRFAKPTYLLGTRVIEKEGSKVISDKVASSSWDAANKRKYIDLNDAEVSSPQVGARVAILIELD